MSDFVEAYKKLLIAQYADKEKATAHISAILSKFEEVYEFAKSFEKAFDVDFAVGKQLDIIGKIVGFNRDNNINDDTYRFFLKCKIVKNYTKSTMIDEEQRLSIQDSIDFIFSGFGYITDSSYMKLTLYVDDRFDNFMIQYAKEANLFPRPMGVEYRAIIIYKDRKTFGFSEHNTGFGDKSKDKIDSYFAYKIK